MVDKWIQIGPQLGEVHRQLPGLVFQQATGIGGSKFGAGAGGQAAGNACEGQFDSLGGPITAQPALGLHPGQHRLHRGGQLPGMGVESGLDPGNETVQRFTGKLVEVAGQKVIPRHV